MGKCTVLETPDGEILLYELDQGVIRSFVLAGQLQALSVSKLGHM